MRYCPTAYTITIAIKAEMPQLVDTLIISEILLSDISIINEETKIEMITKSFLLLYPMTDTCKRLTIFICIDRFSTYHLLIVEHSFLYLIKTDIFV
jgi:hypothetical protein